MDTQRQMQMQMQMQQVFWLHKKILQFHAYCGVWLLMFAIQEFRRTWWNCRIGFYIFRTELGLSIKCKLVLSCSDLLVWDEGLRKYFVVRVANLWLVVKVPQRERSSACSPERMTRLEPNLRRSAGWLPKSVTMFTQRLHLHLINSIMWVAASSRWAVNKLVFLLLFLNDILAAHLSPRWFPLAHPSPPQQISLPHNIPVRHNDNVESAQLFCVWRPKSLQHKQMLPLSNVLPVPWGRILPYKHLFISSATTTPLKESKNLLEAGQNDWPEFPVPHLNTLVPNWGGCGLVASTGQSGRLPLHRSGTACWLWSLLRHSYL